MYTEGQIIDINRTSIPATLVFHFNHSLKPFILIHGNDFLEYAEYAFVDLDEGNLFAWDGNPIDYGCYFYTKEDDEDFCGVEVICDISNYVR